MHSAFENDPTVLLLGEDILDPYGGAFKVSKGLSTKYPERVFTTPIAENAIVGLGVGLALRGFRPIVEIMFGDFITIATDQIINQAAKFELMYAGKVSVPLVVRTPMGAGRGYGPTHSQSLEKLFLGIPNLSVVAPSLFHDPGEELQAAVRDSKPVVFIENKILYPLLTTATFGEFSVEYHRDAQGYSTAVVRNFSPDRKRPDATLITYGGLSRHIESLMQKYSEEEIWIEAILPSCISAVDTEVISSAARRSGRVVLAEEGMEGFGWTSGISEMLYRNLFGQLKAPIATVATASGVIPASFEKEQEMIVNQKHLESALLEVLA